MEIDRDVSQRSRKGVTHTQSDEPTIDWNSSVVSAAELEIDAPIAVVWSVLTQIERWPAWNPAVKAVSFVGPIAEGCAFTWKAGPGTIHSVIERVDRPRLVAWTGKTLGIRAVHVWRLEAQDGKTFVRTEESYNGLVARLLRRPLRSALDTALNNGVRYLKTEAEKTSADGASSTPGPATESLEGSTGHGETSPRKVLS